MTEGSHQLLSLPPRTVMALSDEGRGKACSKRNLIEVSIPESILKGRLFMWMSVAFYYTLIFVKNQIFDYFIYFIML